MARVEVRPRTRRQERDVPLTARGPHSVTLATRADRSVITLTGDMDLDHVEPLRTALHEACAAPGTPARVVVDLSRLDFCDSAGLDALLHARSLCGANGRTPTLADPGPQVHRLLCITGADRVFDLTVAGAAPDGPRHGVLTVAAVAAAVCAAQPDLSVTEGATPYSCR
ncbi:STAS domain-containing protein [Streptomyces erythrochromogenes]|uniref:STAS domain-containing protein n=1 Tax=Streptomyces erythrochromogenes TaxID=285574 RepID=UPI0038274AEF